MKVTSQILKYGLRRPAALASSFLIIILFPLFAFPPAGAVDKIVLPEGMQKVNFYNCRGLTGTTELKDE